MTGAGCIIRLKQLTLWLANLISQQQMILLRNILAGGMLMAMSVAAQNQVNSLPVKTVNGQQYHYYVVQPKETIYSLSRSLGVDRKDIERYNPSVADGLRAGQTLYFPVTTSTGTAVHVVKEKETPYGISRRYGITTAQLMEWNPEARDGIRPGQRLIVSEPLGMPQPQPEAVAEAPKSADDINSSATYIIRDGDTLFGIASRLGTTVDDILALNPGLDRNNYQAGQTITVPESKEVAQRPVPVRPQVPAVAEPVAMPVYKVEEKDEPVSGTAALVDTKEEYPMDQIPSTTYMRYDVKKHETFYSIARSHGLTVEDLEKANPTVGILKEGMVLNIPVVSAPEVAETAAENGENIAGEGNWKTIFGEGVDTTSVAVGPVQSESVDIALMLPLMLNTDSRSKQAQLYTEFYKGFLIAVDSMRRCGSPINIQTYDTEGSASKVESILSTPALEQAEVIIAPDSEAHLALIGDWARNHDVKVLNLFVVKDESYLSNPSMMQGNIPHADMYVKAINGMINRFSRFTPVIITRKDGPDDKAEYIKALKSNLEAHNVDYKEIEFESTLRASDLEVLSMAGSYAFIPTSGRQVELNRITPALIEFSRSSTNPDPVRLFGYPEWTTFRGETLVNMHTLNTLVYSRFYTVPEDPSVREVEDAFVKWYGAPMANFVPRQGLFGFDTGMYLINALKNGKAALSGKAYLGVQNGFDFKQIGAGGWVNDELYFINFRPSGLIDKISL